MLNKAASRDARGDGDGFRLLLAEIASASNMRKRGGVRGMHRCDAGPAIPTRKMHFKTHQCPDFRQRLTGRAPRTT